MVNPYSNKKENEYLENIYDILQDEGFVFCEIKTPKNKTIWEKLKLFFKT